MNPNLRIVLFGLGRAGKIHLKNILAHPSLSLHAVVDIPNPSADNLEIVNTIPSSTLRIDASDCEAIQTLFASNDFDAVVLASPTHTHSEFTLTSLQNRKHVFVEKPLAESLDEINA